MAHVALYRKYRSQTFDDLVGQDHITKTIQAAITSGRIAHAYLFVGPRCTGKTISSRILASSLNFEHGPTPTPCGVCSLCTAITAGNGGDVIELDAASESGVDEVRDIIESAKYKPMEGRYKVFVIDEVHDLSGKAFDALLKTIEEPPTHVVFILATTELNKVPLTIRSRCQRYEFHRGSMRDLVSRLEFVCQSEGIEYEPGALTAIARMADGGYRDSLTLLEQAYLTAEGKITYDGVMRQLGLIDEQQTDRMLGAARAGDVKDLIQAADEAIRLGKEPRSILEALLLRLSELTHTLMGMDDGGDPERHAAAHALAKRIGQSDLLRFRSSLADAHREIRDVSLPRLWLELALLKLVASQPEEINFLPTSPNLARGTEQTPTKSADPTDANPLLTPPNLARSTGETSALKPEPAPTPQTPPKQNGSPAKGMQGDVATKWKETVAHFMSTKPGTGKALQSTFASRAEGKTLYVAFVHRMQMERVASNVKGQQVIVEGFREVIGDPEWQVRFELDASAAEAENVAVQSAADGEQLVSMVEQVFDVKPE
ncbi:MAG: DNA polymerase III subunit gamma/tau [Fimbriimonadales bacterium]